MITMLDIIISAHSAALLLHCPTGCRAKMPPITGLEQRPGLRDPGKGVDVACALWSIVTVSTAAAIIVGLTIRLVARGSNFNLALGGKRMIGLWLAFKHWILIFLDVAVLLIFLGECSALSWQGLTAATPTPTAGNVVPATVTSAGAISNNVVMVGKQVREITSFERGKKVSHQLTTCNAVVTLVDEEFQGIILHPLAVVADGSRKSDGRSRPVFGLEVISVDDLESIDQGVSEYRLEGIELDIGKLNRFSFGQSLKPQSEMQLAVRLFVDDKAADKNGQYYFEFNYDRTIDSRIAIQTMVIPLYEYQWTVIKGGLDIEYVIE